MRRYGGSFDMMIVPEVANMPDTIADRDLGAGNGVGAIPRIWRTLGEK